MTAPDDYLLELRSIDAGYGAASVLHDVSISIRAGSVTAVLGANGAGKTTLLRVAAGLLRPWRGSVSLGGREITRTPPEVRCRAGLCLIPEGRGIFRSLTVRENLELLRPRWEDPGNRERALAAFPMLGERLNQLAGSLSGGQQQMLAVARAYLANPRIILLDEVSMGLAPVVVDEIFHSLESLASTGVALLIVEQYVDRVLEFAQSAYVLSRGVVVWQGRADALDRATLSANYLGSEL
jgi:branched-chain amino acid transport system ATP-binding protein